MNAQLIGITVSDPWTNKAFKETNKIRFPILSDYSRETIRKYNIVHENFAGLKGYTDVKRSVFLTDENGILRYRWVSEDPSKEPNYEEIEQRLSRLEQVLSRLERRMESVSTQQTKLCSNPECRTEGRMTELPIWAKFCDRCGTQQN
jgi:hypothetical protein